MTKDKNRAGKAPGGKRTGGDCHAKRFEKHFRKIRNAQFTGHPQYVYDEDGNKYKVIGITSAPKTGGIPNVRLERNPEPGNENPAFMRPQPTEEKKGAFGPKLKGWKLSAADKQKARDIAPKGDRKPKKP